jgi:hypothetical protein
MCHLIFSTFNLENLFIHFVILFYATFSYILQLCSLVFHAIKNPIHCKTIFDFHPLCNYLPQNFIHREC